MNKKAKPMPELQRDMHILALGINDILRRLEKIERKLHRMETAKDAE